ncbi:hypothetical protein BC828DRAFT_407599 [Blastocladiella britannica]|nr:hypothetical protein BC828DRAFT_407599 [Blastocladiella britannica]
MLAFLSAIATGIRVDSTGDLQFYSYATTYWQCLHSGINIKLLIPKPSKWNWLFLCNDLVTLEWWLQAHLTTGCPLVFPGGGSGTWRFEPGTWLYDVTVTRKISFLIE